METLIIQVNCRPYSHNGPPQLGITVEVPASQQRSLLQKRQQSQATNKEYHNHDYQNLDNLNDFSLTNGHGGSTKLSNSINRNNNNNKLGHSSLRNNNRQHIASVFNGPQEVHEGLQITQIQKGSVIERNGQFKIGDIIVECNGVNLQRPFSEAQKTLKQFVNEHTSHGPLVLKVLRKSASSSSIPSTTGSQITVIEKDHIHSRNSQKSPTMISRPTGSQQQATISTSESPTSPKSFTSSSKTSRYLVDALNTRKIGVKHTIRLKKGSAGGFGIKIAERDNMHGIRKRPIYITAITTSGSAYIDGRLREGDMLLEINGCDLHGKSQPEVIRMLKGVGMNEEVEFVISRQEIASTDEDRKLQEPSSMNKISTENDCDKSLIDLDVPEQDDSVFESSDHQIEQKIDSVLNIPTRDGPGTYVYDIPLNDTKTAGLGLYLKYPRRAEDHKDLGIWIEKVITEGAASKDKRLQPDDQILAINGINLVGLSNAEASETLTAAVCRGIGPEATPNIIRLRIHRRDPGVVAKILQGSNNRIEYSDIIPVNRDKTFSIYDKNFDNSCESYQTALDSTTQYKASEFRNSSDSSNQNSQNDSVMSPQTQASNSLKLTNSYNEKSDQNSSDKTNETTSSAISQITDSTNHVPIDFTTTDRNYDQHLDNQMATQPKSIHTDVNNDLQIVDCTSSSQSWDEESTDAIPGEERFQRDGFGRQSISEKRHAQLNAKNTDTYKRNQRLREEREQQRQLEEQLERQRLDDDRRLSYYVQDDGQNITTSYNLNDFISRPDLQNRVIEPMPNEQIADNNHREVPVDVHMPTEPKIDLEPIDIRRHNTYQMNDGGVRFINEKVPYYDNELMNSQAARMLPINYCSQCGSTNSPCLCQTNQIRNQNYDMNQRVDQMLKRSNSLESIQQHQVREGLIVPRAGTVRVARNRKVNESFRAAVDRSYESNTNESNGIQNQSDLSDIRHASMATKMTGSIANSTASTSNEERYLISNKNASNNNGNTTHKKSSSLLTRFLKFGSMKRKKKIRNPQDDPKPIEMKSSAPKSNRGSERSQSSKGSHARTHSSQSHPNLNNHQCNPLDMKPDPMVNGQLYSHNLKQAAANAASHNQNGFDTHNHRASMPMCQQQYQPMHNTNAHYKLQTHSHHPPMTQAKYPLNMTAMAPARPQAGNNLSGHQQYSHGPLHLNQHQHHDHQQIVLSPHHHHNHLTMGASSIIPQNTGNEHHHYTTHNQMILNPHMNNRLSNGYQAPLPGAATQWQSSHFQAPNGLWVTNSPVSDNLNHPNNVYGSVVQHHNAPSATAMNMHRSSQQQMLTHQQQTATMMRDLDGGTYMTTNGNANGMMQHGPSHPAPLISDNMNNNHHQAPYNAIQPHMLNHQQPQHIYYYDF